MKLNPLWMTAPYERFYIELRSGGYTSYIDKRQCLMLDEQIMLDVHPAQSNLRKSIPDRYDEHKNFIHPFTLND